MMRERPESTLEKELRSLGAEIEVSDSDISMIVATRIAEGDRPKLGRAPFSPKLRLALGTIGVIVALLAGVLVFSPAAREAVANLLGVRGIRVILEASPTPSPLPTGADLDLGSPVSLEQAAALAEFDILVPSSPFIGEPDAIYFDSRMRGGQVSFVYESAPGLPAASTTGAAVLITQFVGDTDSGYYKKVTSAGTQVESVEVNGSAGLWIHGDPHLFYIDSRGREFRQPVRLAGNVLLWERGRLTLRIESSLPKREALEIARSMK